MSLILLHVISVANLPHNDTSNKIKEDNKIYIMRRGSKRCLHKCNNEI